MPDSVLVLVGLVMLLAGAEALVRGAVWIALRAGLSAMMVGATLVAFGTSAPELVAALFATAQGSPRLATGAVLGSNIANLALIVGIVAMVGPITGMRREVRFSMRYLVGVALLTPVPFLIGDEVTRAMGIVLLAGIALFTLLHVDLERRKRQGRSGVDLPETSGSPVLNIAFVPIGILGLYLGGDWLVGGSRGLALSLGISESVVGITVVAVGTSLPEFAASGVAARRGHPEICLGNVVGSNIFNVCMVLGATATVFPPVPWSLGEDGLHVFVGLAMTLFLAALVRWTDGVPRAAGFALFLAYVGYVVTSVVTGRIPEGG